MIKLETNYGKYNYELAVNKYSCNGRTYLGLVDVETKEPICDISENREDLSDEEIYGSLEGHEAIVIDGDFLNCFDSEWLVKTWIRNNIKMCVATGNVSGFPVLYIKN